ncbi:hypothetical protein [Melittangium boletus]|uniref:TIGR02588 family protein n=1 Tax=Melittangium boletus DSM 14713 TaxID=1294270 RepID=A0A250IRV7_9BACT|nr:hypothetical protein [Melittangium boletus]ATB34479.1 hypothetical protein MEBOL_007982 [Melittangium boletus DSM 14713]
MKANRNWLEGVVFLLSCVLVALVLGYVAVDAWTAGDAPPDLVITLGGASQGADGWRVPVKVLNRGDIVAEQVRVGVVLRDGERVLEQAEFFLPYVPRQSEREGWVTFRHEPSRHQLDARALGYAKP